MFKRPEVPKAAQPAKAAKAPKAPKVTTPKLSPTERRNQLILGRMGSLTGWKLNGYVNKAELFKCDATNSWIKKGVEIERNGVKKVVGIGVAKKYTDVVFRKKERKPKSAKPEVMEG